MQQQLHHNIILNSFPVPDIEPSPFPYCPPSLISFKFESNLSIYIFGYVLKITKDLKIEWARNIGGTGNDHFYELDITNDNGVIFVGDSNHGAIHSFPLHLFLHMKLFLQNLLHVQQSYNYYYLNSLHYIMLHCLRIQILLPILIFLLN